MAADCCRACGAAVVSGRSWLPPGAAAYCAACLPRVPGVPFGERLRSLRLAARLTQGQLAARAGVSPASVAAYERGASRPGPEALARLAQALGPGLAGGQS